MWTSLDCPERVVPYLWKTSRRYTIFSIQLSKRRRGVKYSVSLTLTNPNPNPNPDPNPNPNWRSEVLCIFDFDCTLSRMHMFKAMHQSDSKWRKGWNDFMSSRSKKHKGDVEGGASPTSPGSPGGHIEEKPPGLEEKPTKK